MRYVKELREMESLEKEVLAILKRQPERNPDGELWRLKVGDRFYTKAHILEAWNRDEVMRKRIIQLILGLKLHLLGRSQE